MPAPSAREVRAGGGRFGCDAGRRSILRRRENHKVQDPRQIVPVPEEELDPVRPAARELGAGVIAQRRAMLPDESPTESQVDVIVVDRRNLTPVDEEGFAALLEGRVPRHHALDFDKRLAEQGSQSGHARKLAIDEAGRRTRRCIRKEATKR